MKLRPLLTLAWMTFRGSLTGARGIGLLLGAFLPVFVVVGILAYGITGEGLLYDYENLMISLFLPLVLLVITLLLAVPLFREEIDRESLSYLLTRTLGKPAILLGKYLGYLLAAAVVLLPPVVAGYGIVAGWGHPPSGDLPGVLTSLLAITALGIVAYGALYLFLGLVVREALILGLLYAFVWEFLIGGVSGLAPDLSIMHYLRSIPPFLVSGGPMSYSASSLTLAQCLAVPLVFAAVILTLAGIAFHERGFTASPD